MNRRAYGAAGERVACDYLIGRGAEILGVNLKRANGEIDVLAKLDGVFLFVEVKRRAGTRNGRPAEAVNAAKQRRILSAASKIIQELRLEDCRIRFDVIELTPGYLNHIEGAFDASES